MTIDKEPFSPPANRDSEYFIRDQVQMYLPKGIKISSLICNPDSNLALATGWSDPDRAAPKGAEQLFSIISSVRTPYGFELLLHNLARNPQIRKIFIFANGENDNTDVSQRPLDLIHKFWLGGIDEDGKVSESNHRLSEELLEGEGRAVLTRIRQNVDVFDFSQVSGTELLEIAKSHTGEQSPYMDRHHFPEFRVGFQGSLPSELDGMVIRESTGFEAWLKLVGNILRYGRSALLQTIEPVTIKELPNARVIIESPQPFEQVPDYYANSQNGWSKESLTNYGSRMMFPDTYMKEIFPGVPKFFRPANDKYLYAELLWAYPRRKEFELALEYIAKTSGLDSAQKFLADNPFNPRADADLIAQDVMKSDLAEDKKLEVLLELYHRPMNQIEKAIDRLKSIPDDADKTSILWDPTTHGMAYSGRPCLTEVSFLQRDGKLDTYVAFRTHDIAKGWPQNLFGIDMLAQYVADSAQLKRGVIISDSRSAHIYENDLNWVGEMVQEQWFGKKASRVFDASKADPRGNWLITVDEKQIKATLVDPNTGKPMHEIEGKSARDIITQLGHDAMISQTSHAMDIGQQILAAEIALKTGQLFVQDRVADLIRKLQK